MQSFLHLFVFSSLSLLMLNLCLQLFNSQKKFRNDFESIHGATSLITYCSHMMRARKNLRYAEKHLSLIWPKRAKKIAKARKELTRALKARLPGGECSDPLIINSETIEIRPSSTKGGELISPWPIFNSHVARKALKESGA